MRFKTDLQAQASLQLWKYAALSTCHCYSCSLHVIFPSKSQAAQSALWKQASVRRGATYIFREGRQVSSHSVSQACKESWMIRTQILTLYIGMIAKSDAKFGVGPDGTCEGYLPQLLHEVYRILNNACKIVDLRLRCERPWRSLVWPGGFSWYSFLVLHCLEKSSFKLFVQLF